jgi:hypothetical protein
VSRSPLEGRRVGLSTGADVATRDDWPAAFRTARAFGLAAAELCALGASRLPALLGCLASDPAALAPFGYVSTHAPAADAVGRWDEVAAELVALPARVETIVVHPDTVDTGAASLLRPLGARLCFENMDCAKHDGRFPAELARVFAACPEASFCLDVAHVSTHDPSLRLAFELLEAFGGRLRQLHVSGIETDGTHRTTTPADLDLYAPVLKRCPGVPVILEAPLAEP